jgi:hypothetical protein
MAENLRSNSYASRKHVVLWSRLAPVLAAGLLAQATAALAQN